MLRCLNAKSASLTKVSTKNRERQGTRSVAVYFFPVTGFFAVFGVLCGLVLATGAAFLLTGFFAETGVALGRATSGP